MGAKKWLVTVRQASTIDIKELAKLLGCKELRLCSEGEELLGSQKGCITPLSLIYDSDGVVKWAVDETLLSSGSPLRLGTSGSDQAPVTVADVTLDMLESLLSPNGHWPSKSVLVVT